MKNTDQIFKELSSLFKIAELTIDIIKELKFIGWSVFNQQQDLERIMRRINALTFELEVNHLLHEHQIN
jgi:hypothetical protein